MPISLTILASNKHFSNFSTLSPLTLLSANAWYKIYTIHVTIQIKIYKAMSHNKIENFHKKMDKQINIVGSLFVELFHYSALFVIGFIIAWAALLEFFYMIDNNKINIEGILMLFIYLELGAMVGIYFKTQHMPVRYLIYIAITALTRLLILDVSHHDPAMDAVWRILGTAGAILLLCIAVLVVRMATLKYPSRKGDVEDQL